MDIRKLDYKTTLICLLALVLLSGTLNAQSLLFYSSADNDLYMRLKEDGFKVKRFDSPADAVRMAKAGDAVFLMAASYPEPDPLNKIDQTMVNIIKQKQLKAYIEYPVAYPGLNIPDKPLATRLERGVITSDRLGQELAPMTLLGIHDCHVLSVEVDNPLIVLAKVVGFDKAEYGLKDTKTYPLLFEKDGILVSTTGLSNFRKGRYGPTETVRQLWESIVSQMLAKPVKFKKWPLDVHPSYDKNAKIPRKKRLEGVKRGAAWFDQARLFVHPSWAEQAKKFQGDGSLPFGPLIRNDQPVGDGKLGILEGHASVIHPDGTEELRYTIRADVHGETGMALAAAANLFNNETYKTKATNLIDFVFKTSNLRAGEKNDPASPVYGLVGWGTESSDNFYGDDNARLVLGIIAASASLETNKWNKEIVENLIANFRTTGKSGFRGANLVTPGIKEAGWEALHDRDFINPHPHFESWLWACYIWLYDKTGHKPLLDLAKKGIQITMENYPDKWNWTNGIQQERARMILPLAWLVRVEDTPLHRKWLDDVVSKIIENQDKSGALREELGAGAKGMFGTTRSNAEYGLHEAPLIFKNGDPVADMLYTSNFAIFGLNEAAQATGEPRYIDCVNKLSDFLTRIQVKSQKHPDLDGAWFRAFDYGRWDYWASNADAGWGAWSTLTGWIQAWIVTTQAHLVKNTSYWQETKNLDIKKEFFEAEKSMMKRSSKTKYL